MPLAYRWHSFRSRQRLGDRREGLPRSAGPAGRQPESLKKRGITMSVASRSFRVLFACIWAGILTSQSAWSQVSVWTHRYDNARSGANLAEIQLNTSTVNSNQFGKLFSYAVDADVYTQPLVILSVNIAGKGTHNVVYVATNNNS